MTFFSHIDRDEQFRKVLFFCISLLAGVARYIFNELTCPFLDTISGSFKLPYFF